LRATLSVEPSNFNCRLHRKYYTTKLPVGRFQRVLFGGQMAPPVLAAHRTRDRPKSGLTRNAVQLMVEKKAFTVPPAADVAWRAIATFARYPEPSHCRSIFEIAVTLVPFVALWALAWAAVHVGYWELSFLPRDACCRFVNDWVGRFLGVLTLTPYDDSRRAHAIHHANSGHLDRRGVSDIDTLTVREFEALAVWGRLR
jgi:hypothetical protein